MSRIAVVQKDKCNPIGCGGYLCARLCPVNREGKDCIVPSSDKKARIDEKLCTGCGICPNRCPFGAISIINLPEELSEPIHRYGQNGFHLYHLPIPIPGKVVGIIGRNGIGKSTAVKILAGLLKPNLGAEEGAAIDVLIKRFRGTEAQAYFQKLKEQNAIVSYKPQQVDLLPHAVKGTVIELLKNCNGKGEDTLQSVIKKLDLINVQQNSISTLSGGELQRFAIAAAFLKKASIYFFDEPTSFLDIKQRLKVANFIRSIPNENTAVLVVEHDLIVLDAVSDLIHILYGKPQVYGVVAQPKAAKEGINAYLSGFLRDQNMRIRDKAITFTASPDRQKRNTPLITSWTELQIKLGEFSLFVKEGGLKSHEVIGVVGENGIGKTTFVKMLAHKLAPEKGVVQEKVKESYKPQYLAPTNELVSDVLARAITQFDAELLRPLELKELLTRKLSELSGGELQRVEIARCLSQEADVFLLDEPSAYLDIEQRLATARVIREFAEQTGKTILVVDHDLLFLDYVSDRLMVFKGVPARQGIAEGPFSMEVGMNAFLKELDLTFRRDTETGRPRANKKDSVLDREQKEAGKMYYG